MMQKYEDLMDVLKAPRVCGVSALQLLNLLSYLAFVFSSAIGGAGLFGVPRIGDTSNALPVQTTPAGYAFSIWSLIFVLLGILTLLQLLPVNREWSASRLGLWWVVNAGICEALWPFAFVYRWGGMWVSAALLGLIVATAAGLYLQMRSGVAPLSDARAPPSKAPPSALNLLHRPSPAVSLVESLLCQGGVAIYMGWTSCAFILNVSIALSQSGVGTTKDVVATASAAVLTAAAIVAMCGALTRTDWMFAGAISWALAAIHVNQLRPGFVSPRAVLDASLATAVLAGAAAALALLWRVGMLATGRLALAPLALALGGEEFKGGVEQRHAAAGRAAWAADQQQAVVTENVVAWK